MLRSWAIATVVGSDKSLAAEIHSFDSIGIWARREPQELSGKSLVLAIPAIIPSSSIRFTFMPTMLPQQDQSFTATASMQVGRN